MAEAQVVGNVVYVSGQVLARNADGELRVLKVGDTVLEGEVIITGPGARLINRRRPTAVPFCPRFAIGPRPCSPFTAYDALVGRRRTRSRIHTINATATPRNRSA